MQRKQNPGQKEPGKEKRRIREEESGVPTWLWGITWGIMLAGIGLNLIGLLMR